MTWLLARSRTRAVARLVAFDLRRFRVPIAVLAGLELLRAASAEWSLHGVLGSGSPLGTSGVIVDFRLVDGALLLATTVVTAILVQADHPGDDRGFLRSRPIGRWELAVAKLLLIAGLVTVVPLVVTAVRLFAYSAPASSFGASAVQFVVIGGAAAIPAWVLALLTRTLPRFLVAAAGVVIVWTIALSAAVSWAGTGWLSERLQLRVPAAAGLTAFAAALADWQHADARGWLFALGTTIAAAAMLVTYYRTRGPVTSLLAGAVLVTVPAFLPSARDSTPPSADVVAAAHGPLQLRELVLPQTLLRGHTGRREDDGALMSGIVVLPPLPAGMSAQRRLGPTRVTAPGFDESFPGWPVDDDARRIRLLAAGGTWPGPPNADHYLFWLARRHMDALRDRVADVEAPVDLRFSRHTLVGELPHRAGVAFRTREYLLEIVSEDEEAGWLHGRFTRFPAISRHRAEVTPFIAFSPGRVEPAMHGALQSLDPVRVIGVPDEGLGWAYGRTWSLDVVLSRGRLPHDETAQPEPRLRIVESRPAGTMRSSLAARGVPVRTRPPQPPPEALQMELGLR